MTSLTTDVVVIGGGATGTGVLRDLAMRGFSALLLERADLAQGTTGRFHGLLHSGGRYVVSDPESATECAQENEIVRRIHSDAVEETGGLFVVTPNDSEEYADSFLAAAAAARVPAREISVAEALRREPRLHPKMKRAFEVRDAVIDGWRMVWGTVASAQEYGARTLTYHRVTSIHTDQGNISGVSAIDEKTGEKITISCRAVINAGGPWAGKIAALAGAHGVDVVPGRGIMVAMNHRLVNTVINRCVYPADGDILVPDHTVCIIGTTDQHASDPDFLEISTSEVQQMLDAGEAMIPGFRQARAIHVWAGARPLVRDQRVSTSDTRHMSRGMSIIDHHKRDGIAGFFSIAGGKLTTYRLMAKNVVDALCEQLGENRPCRTAEENTPGATPRNHAITDRLAHAESVRQSEQLICECELVTRSMIEQALADQPHANFDDLRRQLRIGMGPCQGTFCAPRLAGIVHAWKTSQLPSHSVQAARNHARDIRDVHSVQALTRCPAPSATHQADVTTTQLRLFARNRESGITPLLFNQQLREAALNRWVMHSTLGIEHLPQPSQEAILATGDLALLYGTHTSAPSLAANANQWKEQHA
ncbi:MAG: anaerobic glycerol-3-phosphate dehydrogenase subunit GlpA [Actinomycetaceae bacterium]|nr:anaerobic glycerol-3-phosphate dehydrogenase subunit GlpA [Actinomycetaceae bacterium]